MDVSPLDWVAIRQGKEKEKETGRTALEERVFLDLPGTVGTQSVFGVTTQQSCDEIPCILLHLTWELERIIQDLPIHFGRILYTFRVNSSSSHTTKKGMTVERGTDHHKTVVGPQASRTAAHQMSTSQRACRTRRA